MPWATPDTCRPARGASGGKCWQGRGLLRNTNTLEGEALGQAGLVSQPAPAVVLLPGPIVIVACRAVFSYCVRVRENGEYVGLTNTAAGSYCRSLRMAWGALLAWANTEVAAWVRICDWVIWVTCCARSASVRFEREAVTLVIAVCRFVTV